MKRLMISCALAAAVILALALCLAGCSDLEGDGDLSSSEGSQQDLGQTTGQTETEGEDDATGPVIAEEKDATGPVIVDEQDATGPVIEDEQDATGPVIVDEAGATGPVIATGDALQYVGQTVTVTGVIVAVKDYGPKYGKYVISLDSDQNGQGFNVLIKYENADAGPITGPSWVDQVGRTMNVTGEVYLNASENKGEIEVIDSSQVDLPIDT